MLMKNSVFVRLVSEFDPRDLVIESFAGRFGARIFAPDSERRRIAQRISAQTAPARIAARISTQQGGRRALKRAFQRSNWVGAYCRAHFGATNYYRALPRAFPRKTCHGCVNRRNSPNREELCAASAYGSFIHGRIQSKTYAMGMAIGDLRSLYKENRLKELLHILHVHGRKGTIKTTYASLLQECVNNKALSEGKLVHAHMIETGFKPDRFLGNTIVNMYAKCGSPVAARRFFDEMPERNVVSWTVMISAYARHGLAEEALTLFCQMQRTSIQPNHLTFASVLSACANMAALEHGNAIHEQVIRTGFKLDVSIGNTLVDMYAKCGSIEIARRVFDEMPNRNLISWNAMIAGLTHNGDIDDALKLFQKMPEPNVLSWTTMISGYAQNGHIDEALKLFQEMPERDVVSWNAMIAGYVQNGCSEEALKLYGQMQLAGAKPNAMTSCIVLSACGNLAALGQGRDVHQHIIRSGFQSHAFVGSAIIDMYAKCGVKPNLETFISVLPACANLAALEHGKEIHKIIIKNGFLSNVIVGSALVDMYAKCGSIEDAYKVFDNMPRRDIISWNAMIVGYAIHGCGKEALQLFEQMLCSAIHPSHVTFVGVLSACCHAGLVDEGWQYFDSMSKYYHIAPAMEHYGCMVDLLGRAGLLDEVQDFISKMPIKPDAAVLGSMLGACKIHNNIELGECVAEQLFKLDPKNATPYVVLSNIYGVAGRWNDVENVRKNMKDRRIKKKAGCSWIEVNKRMYAFLVEDGSCPQMHKIYVESKRLPGQMKVSGYAPDTRFVLNDVE
eukprot:Gb_20547 [translate_table: standard]